jgi:hypothetical protein
MFVRIIKRKRKFEIRNSSLFILDSARVLRKIYERLHAEDHINNKAAISTRADEKLTAKNKILRIKNEDLRGTIFENKRKKKRDKFFNFSKESEQKNRILFFNSAKIVRARERAAALEETELQQKRTTADKKLQKAITREEKAREAAEKKARKEIEYTAAREEAAREKLQKRPKKRLKKHNKRARQSCAKLKLKRNV